MSIIEIQTEEQFNLKLEECSESLILALFHSKLIEKQATQMKDALEELIKINPPKSLVIFLVDIDKNSLFEKNKIEVVPSVLFIAKSKVVDKVEGTDIPTLVKKVRDNFLIHFPLYSQIHSNEASSSKLNNYLKELINKDKLMIFMKGNPDQPRCKFSKQLISILKTCNAKYETFDILENEDVRQGLKEYSNWPTYPQIYLNGELLGGIDILQEMYDSNEFQDLLESNNLKA